MSGPSRNAPCPCDSGKKYKACCLEKDEANRKPHTGEDAVMVLMPTRGQLCVETQMAIENNMRDVQHVLGRVARKPVVEARNMLARSALQVQRGNPFNFTPREFFALWIDDDAWFPPGMVSNMLKIMRYNPTIDALFANFGKRIPYSSVVAFRDPYDDQSFPKVGVDCGPEDLVDVQRAGMHFCLMRMSLLERMGENPFDIIKEELSEDFSFCARARAVGARLVVAMQMLALHIDADTGLAYAPGQAAFIMEDNLPRTIDSKMADELRAKTNRRHVYGGSLDANFVAIDNRNIDKMQSEVEKRIAIMEGAA